RMVEKATTTRHFRSSRPGSQRYLPRCLIVHQPRLGFCILSVSASSSSTTGALERLIGCRAIIPPWCPIQRRGSWPDSLVLSSLLCGRLSLFENLARIDDLGIAQPRLICAVD